MTDTPEALAEKWRKLTREDYFALLARLAEAEERRVDIEDQVRAIMRDLDRAEADRDRWREKYKAATQLRRAEEPA